MPVSNKYFRNLCGSNTGNAKLSLCALSAVNKNPLVTVFQKQRDLIALRRRNHRACSKESDFHHIRLKKVFKYFMQISNMPVKKQKETQKVKKVKAQLLQERVIADDTNESKEIYDQSRFGERVEDKFQYALVEALYLVEKGRMLVYDSKKKRITKEDFIKKAQMVEPTFWVRYAVYKDMRNRGYIVKTALMFGADFRVYERGIKPGEDHAKWILYPVHEGGAMTWYEFAAKNRVAHSTRKRLLLGIVDEENDVTYYEVAWKRP